MLDKKIHVETTIGNFFYVVDYTIGNGLLTDLAGTVFAIQDGTKKEIGFPDISIGRYALELHVDVTLADRLQVETDIASIIADSGAQVATMADIRSADTQSAPAPVETPAVEVETPIPAANTETDVAASETQN